MSTAPPEKEKKKKRGKKAKRAPEGPVSAWPFHPGIPLGIALGLGVFTWLAWSPRPRPIPQVETGNKLYGQTKFREALREYETAPGAGVRNAGVQLDRGLARFRVSVPPGDAATFPLLERDAAAPEGLEKAQDEFRTAARGDSTGSEQDIPQELRARALYDLGNTHFAEHNWDAAMESYKAALRLRPGWLEPAWNLSLARRFKDEEKEQPDAGPEGGTDASETPDGNNSDASSNPDGDQNPQDGGSQSPDGGQPQGDSGSPERDSGSSSKPDGGNGEQDAGGAQQDAGAPPQEDPADAGPRTPPDAAPSTSLSPLDELDRDPNSFQREVLRRRSGAPRRPEDDR